MKACARPGDTLLVFVKAPRAGAVKTRIATALGPALAARLYRRLAEEVMERTTPRGAYRRLLCYWPAEAEEEISAWFPGESLEAQTGPDLGARMANAFANAFGRGDRRVALIGSDAPWISRRTVSKALDALDRCDVVVAPSHDGGYGLVALDRPRPGLFSGIRWSTPTVLAATVQRARDAGLRLRRLEPLPDVDTLDDVKRFRRRLAPVLARDAGLAGLLGLGSPDRAGRREPAALHRKR